MLEQGRLIRADPFSFTRGGEPFVAFEYGSQLLFALAERAGGLPAVAVLAGLLIALAYALLTRFLLRRGVDPLLACLTLGLAVALGAGHWSARPHLFSYAAVVVLLGMLEGKLRRTVLPCAALFAAWANLHGGFVYGWILICVYLVGNLLEQVWGGDRSAWRDRSRHYSAMLAAAVAATVLNPYGLELHRHLITFFRTPYLMDHTAEFASPDFHEAGARVFLAILLLTVASLTLRGRRPTLPRLLLIGAGAAFALISIRNIPLFGLTALPVLALHLDEVWRRLPDPSGVRGRFELTTGRTSTLVWVLPVLVLLCGLAGARGRVGSLQVIGDRFDGSIFPAAAVAKARNERLHGHLYTEFTWGGYIVYAWPEQKIFIDGGTDFFGEDIFRQYSRIRHLMPGWRELLDRWDISLMLLNRNSELAHELARNGRWRLWYCDALAVLFRRSEGSSAASPAASDSGEQELRDCGKGSPSALRQSNQRDSPRQRDVTYDSGLHGQERRESFVDQPGR
jgi:hypothetical protein